MLDDFDDIASAFSFGIADDASWDLDIAERGIRTYQFDHTINRAPSAHPNLVFTARKIVGLPGNHGATIAELLDGHASNAGAVNILKMDIEGDEWSVFDLAEPQHLRRFAQVVCEFHDFQRADGTEWFERAMRVMQKLRAHFEVVHVHGNNCGRQLSIANVLFPEVLEVTFANREKYEFTECEELFPTSLDHPNTNHRPDLFLGHFRF